MKSKPNISTSKYWKSPEFSRFYNWWKEKNLELSIDSNEIPIIKTNEFLKSNWYSLTFGNWKLDQCENALQKLRKKRNKTFDDKHEMMRLSRLMRGIDREISLKCSPASKHRTRKVRK